MRITVRQARSQDRDTIVAMNAAMALETEGVHLDTARLTRGVDVALREPGLARYFMAERQGTVVGQLMLTTEWSDWRCGVFWWIQSVYVVPGARREGVFSHLYEHVKASAAQSQDPEVCGIRLYVERDNTVARSTYDALGMDESHYRLYEVDFVVKRSR